MAARVSVRLTPRAAKDAIGTPREDGVLPVRVTAPPVDGRANAALCRLLARELGVARTRVTVVGGHTSREKVVAVEGVDPAELRRLLNLRSTN